VLPPAFAPLHGIVLPFVNVRLIGNRAILAGNGPQSRQRTPGKTVREIEGEVLISD
jgi:hypothetical protein